MHLLIAFLLSALVACNGAIASIPLFKAYQGLPPQTYPCFRQPVLVVVNPSTLLVFVEGRNNTYCSGTSDGNIKAIYLRRSVDGGNTWSSPTLLLTSATIDFLTAMSVPNSNKVIHWIQDGGKVIQLISNDAGATWSAPSTFTIPVPAPYKSFYPSVGHGIVVDKSLCLEPTCGNTAGRFVMPMILNTINSQPGDVACPTCRSSFAVSDDQGATWRLGSASIQIGSREAAVIQLVGSANPYSNAGSSVLFASERNMGNLTGHRWHSVSTDGGSSFNGQFYAYDNGIPDSVVTNWTGIVAGGSRFDTGDGIRRVVITTPANPTARADYTVYLSLDETKSWSAGTLLVPGPAGYSDALQLNSTHLAVVFENGVDEFSEQISFALLSVDDL